MKRWNLLFPMMAVSNTSDQNWLRTKSQQKVSHLTEGLHLSSCAAQNLETTFRDIETNLSACGFPPEYIELQAELVAQDFPEPSSCNLLFVIASSTSLVNSVGRVSDSQPVSHGIELRTEVPFFLFASNALP